MSNPSTIWTSLSLPLSPSGAIPFVDTDQVSIITDVGNLKYSSGSSTADGAGVLPYQLKVTNGLRLGYAASASVGTPVAINSITGRFTIGAGNATKVITNTLVVTTSVVQFQLENNDATLTRVIATIANGQFTVTGNAAATGNVVVSFVITN